LQEPSIMPAHGSLRLLLVGLWVAIAALPAGATTVVMMADTRLASQSELVVVARSVGTVPAPELDRPVTDYLMSIERVMLGSLDSSAIVVRVPGGTAANGMSLKIWGAPEFVTGERVILFLNRAEDGTYRVVQLVLGSFREALLDGQRVAFRDLSEVNVLERDSKPSRAERRLREFDRFADWLADYGSGVVRPRDYFVRTRGAGGAQLLPMYNLFLEAGKNLRWFEFDRGNSVGWRLDPDGFPGLGSSGQAEFEAGMAAWNNEPQTPINYQYRGTSGLQAGFGNFDGQNVALFGDPNDDVEGSFSCPGGGTLAVGGPWYSTSTTAVFNGRTYIRIQGADIVLNDGVECYFSRPSTGSPAASELFAHELGHTLGLAHSSENDSEPNPTLRDALMYYHLHSDGRGAGLRSDDLAAIRALYTTSGGGGGGGGGGNCPGNALCLHAGRFQISLTWTNQFNGVGGVGKPIVSTPYAGYFYFDQDPTNIELVVKVLNYDGKILVFFSQLTVINFQLQVTDTLSGVTKVYSNSAGNCGGLDADFLGVPGTAGVSSGGPAATIRDLGVTEPPSPRCVANSSTLCLLGGRFKATLPAWRNQYNEATGSGSPVSLSNLTGAFHFSPNPQDLDTFLKLNQFPDKILVFWGALNNLQYTLRLTDTRSGRTMEISNPAGTFCGGLDQSTFVP